ncbi:MAG: COX15/CtaA family protein [Solirubrobacteraceae bacterium]|jgi:cytochrome c oxidase assembly protein subunit 15
MRARLASLTVTPREFERVAQVALVALTLIVLTGAAVRLSGSGLGCPNWPRCYGHVYPPLDTHALIEFSNRVVGAIVGVVTIVAAAAAWRRRPFRRDLAWLALLLPLGVVAQAVLGGYTVEEKLAPGFVMAHFALSMVILIAAVALVWRAREADDRARYNADRPAVWAVRALSPLAVIVLFAGTAATAAGPHSGGAVGQLIKRLHFDGAGTLNLVIHAHGALAFGFGLVSVVVWVMLERRQAGASLRRAVSLLCVLIAVQGIVGTVQYETHLPSELVWVHVALATLTWLCVLWSVAAAGRLEPRARRNTAQIRP